jgi:hypothetical protein
LEPCGFGCYRSSLDGSNSLQTSKCDSIRLKDAVKDVNTLAYVATSTGPPIRGVTQMHAISLDFSTTDDARLDEHITAPIFNYARFLAWVQAVMMVFDKFDNVCDRNLQNEKIAPGQTLHDRNSPGGWGDADRSASHRLLSPETGGASRLATRSFSVVPHVHRIYFGADFAVGHYRCSCH